jgi:broad specificity phosphatase PhoE
MGYYLNMTPILKKTFYFVRHGQTDANANSLMCGGDWDIALNSVGLLQAKNLSEKIESLTPKIELICISPMIRTQETARNINLKAGLPTLTVEGLREWRVGDWEKRPWQDVPNPFNTTEDPTNGESREVFENRVSKTINEELNKHSETILFVSHGAFAHALFTVMGVDQLQISNCEIYKVYPEKASWCISKVS